MMPSSIGRPDAAVFSDEGGAGTSAEKAIFLHKGPEILKADGLYKAAEPSAAWAISAG